MGPPLFNGGSEVGDLDLLHGPSLQWGRRSSTAEVWDEMVKERGELVASMGPPLFNGGSSGMTNGIDGIGASFNGAAALQRRKSMSDAPSPLVMAGFNGAAALQRRKYRHPKSSACHPKGFNGAAALQRRK